MESLCGSRLLLSVGNHCFVQRGLPEYRIWLFEFVRASIKDQRQICYQLKKTGFSNMEVEYHLQPDIRWNWAAWQQMANL